MTMNKDCVPFSSFLHRRFSRSDGASAATQRQRRWKLLVKLSLGLDCGLFFRLVTIAAISECPALSCHPVPPLGQANVNSRQRNGEKVKWIAPTILHSRSNLSSCRFSPFTHRPAMRLHLTNELSPAAL